MEKNRQTRGVFAHLGGKEAWLFRIAGPGLGNMLFPWARALIAGRVGSLPVIAPTWPQLKLGPLLRREKDLRSYAFQFRARAGELTGTTRLGLLSACEHIDEENRRRKRGLPGAGIVRVFEGMGAHFVPLLGEADFLRAALLEATDPALLPDPSAGPTVAVHLRCGDFRLLNLENNAPFPERGIPPQYRVPLRFVVEAIQDVLEILGPNAPVCVYSDGADEELAPALQLPNVVRSRRQAAITDLLEMSNARILIGAPHSTFSMWSAFLGKSIHLGFPEDGGRSYGISPCCTTVNRQERLKFLETALT